MSLRIKILLIVVLVALLIVVSLQNSAPVQLRFLFWGATVDRLLLFPFLYLLGVMTGVILTWAVRKRRQVRTATKESDPAP